MYVRSMVAAVAVAALASWALAQDSVKLQYGDGTADGKRSTAQAGYVVTFDAPEATPVLRSIAICAARYGRTEPRDFTVTICDYDLNAVAVFGFPYELLPYGSTPGWVELPLPAEVHPPKQFSVAIYAHCLQDCGVYMGLDRVTAGECRSFSVLPGATEARQPDVDGQAADWMIRCSMASEATVPADAPLQLALEDGRVSDFRSMGGVWQAVRFEPPDDATYLLDRVLIAGAYYGMPGTDGGNNAMAVAVADEAGVAYAQKEFRYDEFYRGNTPSWTSLPMGGEIEVKGPFTLLVDMRSRATPGVYLGFRDECETAASFVGRPGELGEWTPPGDAEGAANWCVRAVLHKKP